MFSKISSSIISYDISRNISFLNEVISVNIIQRFMCFFFSHCMTYAYTLTFNYCFYHVTSKSTTQSRRTSVAPVFTEAQWFVQLSLNFYSLHVYSLPTNEKATVEKISHFSF